MGCIAAKLSGKKFIIAERSNPNKTTVGLKFISEIVMGYFSDGIICNSSLAVKFWRKIRGSEKNIRYTRNIISYDEINNADRCNIKFPYALFVGRLDKNKNIINIVKAIHNLSRENIKVNLMIVGEGPLRKTLEDFIDNEKLNSQVFLLGQREDTYSLMKSAKLYISTSYYEGQPNAVLEAYAAGCELILSDISEHKNIIDSSVAYFVQPSSIFEIADKIKLVFFSSVKRNLNVDFDKIQLHSAEKIACEHIKFFQEIIQHYEN